MTTIIIVTTILFVSFMIGLTLERQLQRKNATRNLAVAGLSVCYVYFGIGHFALTEELAAMIPAFIPAREAIVYATGLLEFFIAVGLLVPFLRRWFGLLSIAVLIGFFPINIYSAVAGVGLGANELGVDYLWYRTPLQVLLIFWSYWFAVRAVTTERKVAR